MPDQSTLLNWALGLNGVLLSTLIGVVVRNSTKVDARFDGIDKKFTEWAKDIESKLKDFYLVIEKRFDGVTLSIEKKHDVATTGLAVVNKDIEQLRHEQLILRSEQERIRERVHDLEREPHVAGLLEYLERRDREKRKKHPTEEPSTRRP